MFYYPHRVTKASKGQVRGPQSKQDPQTLLRPLGTAEGGWVSIPLGKYLNTAGTLFPATHVVVFLNMA